MPKKLLQPNLLLHSNIKIVLKFVQNVVTFELNFVPQIHIKRFSPFIGIEILSSKGRVILLLLFIGLRVVVDPLDFPRVERGLAQEGEDAIEFENGIGGDVLVTHSHVGLVSEDGAEVEVVQSLGADLSHVQELFECVAGLESKQKSLNSQRDNLIYETFVSNYTKARTYKYIQLHIC